MKQSLPVLFFASIATTLSVFCHAGSKDDKTKVRRRAAHEKRDNFGANNNIGNTDVDSTHEKRTHTQGNGGYQALIVGGTQASSNEYPYYGK
jgi:hypothetical protein